MFNATFNNISVRRSDDLTECCLKIKWEDYCKFCFKKPDIDSENGSNDLESELKDKSHDLESEMKDKSHDQNQKVDIC
jgi:hypothetical protein